MGIYRHMGSTEKLTVAAGAPSTSTITSPVSITLAVHGTVDFHFVIADADTEPAATTADFLLPAGQVHYLNLDPGEELSVRGSGNGNVYVQRVTLTSET